MPLTTMLSQILVGDLALSCPPLTAADVVTKKIHCSFAHEAIEVLLAIEPRSIASDVWSLGTVMWEVFSDGAVPFDGLDLFAVTSSVCSTMTSCHFH
jgi:serine/threonine protein kinase